MADNPLPNSSRQSQRTSVSTATDTKPKDFCDIAVERGYCTAEQVRRAQEDLRCENSSEEISAYLIRLGIITQQHARACERAVNGPTIIAGFEILEKVGQGGMGAVFRAKQVSMDRVVALKILPPKLAQNPSFKKRFLHEARLSAKLSHLNIIAGIDCGEAGGYTFFAMEFVDGKTVKKILKERGKIPCDEAIEIVRQIGEALVYAQAHSLVHRDIKPDNIMLTDARIAKLCDLGLAKQTENPEDASLTQAGQAVGTPHYISPEQARGQKDVDTRSDIYSLGATFYHMLTGKTPFNATTSASVMALHLTEQAPNPCDLESEIPIEFGEIISKMMAKSAADRYQSAQEFLDDLDAVQNGEATSASKFDEHSSCALPDSGAAPARGSNRGHSQITSSTFFPTLDRRLPTGRHRPVGGTLGSFMGSGIFLALLTAGGYYWYTTQYVKKTPEVVQKPQPVVPENPKKDDPPSVVPKESTAPIQSKSPEKITEKNPKQVPTKPDETKVSPDVTEKQPDKVATPETDKAVVSSKRVPPPPKEMDVPKMELTSDMLYARFLSEMPHFTSKGDLQKAQNEVRDLSNKPEFSIARQDLNAELADYNAAMQYELDAMKSRAATGGTVDLNEEAAKKWETNKGKIIGFDPNKGLMVEIVARGGKLQLPIAASGLPLTDILRASPDSSALGPMRYLSARGNYKEASAMLPKLSGDENEKQRWKRKFELALNGEKELQASAVFSNLSRIAGAKSWKTFMAVASDYEKKYLDTQSAKETLVVYNEMKNQAKTSLTPVEGFETGGRFSAVKWPGLNTSKAELKTDPEYGNRTLLIEGEAAPEEADNGDKSEKKTEKPERPAKGEKGEKGEKSKPITAEHDKAAVMRAFSDPLDLSDKNVIAFRARHKNEKPLSVAIGFLCGDQYYETPQVSIGEGDWYENRIRIDGATFKSAKNDYKSYDYELGGRDNVRGLVILIYTKEAFSIELDAIHVKQEK